MSSSKNIGLFKIPEKIVVVGDIHADYETLIKTLQYAGLINKKLEWTGKKTHLVAIGDLVDGKNRVGDWTNDSDIRVIYFLEKLMSSANKKGGKVVILLGNHEFMNMSGNFSYSGVKGIKEMGGENGRAKYFRGEFKQFAKKCYLAVQYDDWIFCHAGIAPEISKKYSIHDLNTLLLLYLDNKMNDEINFIVDLPDVRDRFEKLGALPFKMKPAAFDKFIQEEAVTLGEVMKASGAKLD